MIAGGSAFRGANRLIGLATILFALGLLLIWIPLDVDSAVLHQIRRRTAIGDALAPALAGVILLGAGIWLVLLPQQEPTGLSMDSVRYLGTLIGLFIAVLMLMRWTGPAVVWLASALTGEALQYRLLRDSLPWKYFGYVSGGTGFIYFLSIIADGRGGWRRLGLAFAITLGFALFYDWPFEDLLLPPNGDV